MTFKGCLQVRISNVKAVFRQKFTKSSRNQGPKWCFLRKGGLNVDYGFVTPKRHILAQNCVFWCILHQNLRQYLDCTRKNAKNCGVNNVMCDVRHACKQDPQSDLERNLQNDRYPWPMHILITMAMKGLLGLSHIFERYLLNTSLENENVHMFIQVHRP